MLMRTAELERQPPWSFVLCRYCGEYTFHKDLAWRWTFPEASGMKLFVKGTNPPRGDLEFSSIQSMCAGCERKYEEKSLDFQSVT